MTVLDSSVVVDFLLGTEPAAGEVRRVLEETPAAAAPDLLVFEVLAVLRRHVLRGGLTEGRAHGAIDDLADLPIELYPSLMLREVTWSLRENLTTSDALFAALAQLLAEPLLTRDASFARAAREHARVQAVVAG